LALASSAPQAAPPAELRAWLLTEFMKVPAATPEETPGAGAKPAGAALPAPPASRIHLLHFIPWAAAAAMAVLFYQNRGLITKAQQETQAARTESASLKEREKHLISAVSSSDLAKSQNETELATARVSLAKAEASLTELGGKHEAITAELAQLREDSQFDKTRIAVLGSLLKNQPGAVAVSVWRQERQEGLLVVENLPALPAGRDYQLWVIDPNLKTPVSAGIFKVDAAGKVRIEFKPDRVVQSAYKFAVTVEKEGGAKVPTLDQMVVIGG
jgi:anti-sigma-K factor RskA